MTQQSSSPRIVALVLAAGTSTRFGDTKMIAPLHGKPLIQHALEAVQEACSGSVNLVVGHDKEAVVNAAAELANQIIVNINFAEGLGTSIAAGVQACRERADAILVLLGDQPLITNDHLTRLVEVWSGAPDEIVASSFDEVQGPPILFPGDCFDELVKLTGDMGARFVMTNKRFVVKSIPCPAARFDVDGPVDLQRLNET
jgi:molybdenum cofactor cytidylyltransferase